MSKMDQLRALREARYERTVARGASQPQRPPKPAEPPASTPANEVVAVDPGVQLCGHRAISGRTCTREHGHAAKSHRYS